MPIKFDNVNATYRAAVYFDSNATKSKCRLNAVIDSGCTLSTIGIVQLLESLEMTLKEFLRYYKDLSQVEFLPEAKLGDGTVAHSKLICLRNFTIVSVPHKVVIQKFYCRLLFPRVPLKELFEKLESLQEKQPLSCPSMFLGTDVIMACDTFTFFKDYAYMNTFNESYYLELVKRRAYDTFDLKALY